MSATISITPDRVRTDPSIQGLEVTESEWRLDVARYREFVRETTGVDVAEGLSAGDCYRIGNRLQAHIEERKRRGEWTPALIDGYPAVETLEEVVWLARFFRACHECHAGTEGVCFPAFADDARSCR